MNSSVTYPVEGSSVNHSLKTENKKHFPLHWVAIHWTITETTEPPPNHQTKEWRHQWYKYEVTILSKTTHKDSGTQVNASKYFMFWGRKFSREALQN